MGIYRYSIGLYRDTGEQHGSYFFLGGGPFLRSPRVHGNVVNTVHVAEATIQGLRF